MAAGVRPLLRSHRVCSSLILLVLSDVASCYRVHVGSMALPTSKIKQLEASRNKTLQELETNNSSKEGIAKARLQQYRAIAELTGEADELRPPTDQSSAVDALAKGASSKKAPDLSSANTMVSFDENIIAKKEEVRDDGGDHHSIYEIIGALKAEPHRRVKEGCFADVEESRVGCRGTCRCMWYEQCFPKHVLMLDGRDKRMLHVDVGTCSAATTAMFVAAVASFMLSILFIVWIRMILADKKEAPPKKMPNPIVSYPVLTINSKPIFVGGTSSNSSNMAAMGAALRPAAKSNISNSSYPVLHIGSGSMANNSGNHFGTSSTSTDGSGEKGPPVTATAPVVGG